ncbi:unnamed protein product, partial [Meganyctiphanes norvegica]
MTFTRPHTGVWRPTLWAWSPPRSVAVTAVVVQRFDVGVADVVGAVGDLAVLTCDVSTMVQRHVTRRIWTIDGRDLQPSITPAGRHWVMPTGELVILGLAPSDAYSRITCSASHAFSPTIATSQQVRVVLQGTQMVSRPQLLLRQEVVQPLVGEDLVLTCLAKGYPKPDIRWYREDVRGMRTPLQEGLSPRAAHLQVVSGQLVLRGVRLKDSASYSCTANNSQGQDHLKVLMEVRSRLTVEVTPVLQRVDLGRPASLTCQVTGSPVTQVTWYKDAQPLGNSPRAQVYDRNLHINRVSREDAGMYQCIASNQEDAAQGAAQIDLGDSAPVWEYRFISQTLQPGPAVSLKCIASGSPMPHISWTLDGYPIPEHER